MEVDRGDYRMMKKNERAHFFSPKEQELILKLYEEEREILTAKSNTTSASRNREDAWQRIADKINAASDSGYKRTWQQVKVKHKNIVQTAKRRRLEVMRIGAGSATPSLNSAEEDVLLHKDNSRLRVEVLPSGACIEPLSESEGSLMSGQPVLLLPITKTEPESLSSDETDVSDTQFEGEIHNSALQGIHNSNLLETTNSACAANGSKEAERRHKGSLLQLPQKGDGEPRPTDGAQSTKDEKVGEGNFTT
ncbi:uncharacterized protein LOC121510032 isoform X2 [Cheilinus undulatus]|uniref:uncharacterized protein LOC121510032 isoform X2 n=1 Tax=Cheilinus undulatus TaxID=241271 RepID=UPI001BD39761|nr:uncharacterized protein LOC121510032 isoform X2 [Cheilinus undulatus]